MLILNFACISSDILHMIVFLIYMSTNEEQYTQRQ